MRALAACFENRARSVIETESQSVLFCCTPTTAAGCLLFGRGDSLIQLQLCLHSLTHSGKHRVTFGQELLFRFMGREGERYACV